MLLLLMFLFKRIASVLHISRAMFIKVHEKESIDTWESIWHLGFSQSPVFSAEHEVDLDAISWNTWSPEATNPAQVTQFHKYL
ncbi:unnamed protein product [Calypogeia fissa]